MLKRALKLVHSTPSEDLRHIEPLAQTQGKIVEVELAEQGVMQTTMLHLALSSRLAMLMDKAWTVRPL